MHKRNRNGAAPQGRLHAVHLCWPSNHYRGGQQVQQRIMQLLLCHACQRGEMQPAIPTQQRHKTHTATPAAVGCACAACCPDACTAALAQHWERSFTWQQQQQRQWQLTAGAAGTAQQGVHRPSLPLPLTQARQGSLSAQHSSRCLCLWAARGRCAYHCSRVRPKAAAAVASGHDCQQQRSSSCALPPSQPLYLACDTFACTPRCCSWTLRGVLLPCPRGAASPYTHGSAPLC